MNRWFIYDETGRIDRIYSGSEHEASFQAQDSESLVVAPEGMTDVNAYVANGVPMGKQALPITVSSTTISANGTDEAVISGIPAGTTVEWPDGQIDEVTDGEVRFSVDLPGTYTLIFDAVPYLRQEVTIEAVAAT